MFIAACIAFLFFQSYNMNMYKKSTVILASLGCISAAFLWGFAFVVVKDSLDYIPAIYMIAIRFTIATIGLSIIFLKKLKEITFEVIKKGIILGLLLFLAYLFQTIGCNYTTAGKNAFLTTLYVILVPFLTWPLSKHHPHWFIFIAAIFEITGIALLSLQINSKNSTINIGDLLTLICSIFYALHIIYTARSNEFSDPIILTILQFFFTSLFSWVAAPFVDGVFIISTLSNFHIIISLVYLGIFSTMIAFLFQNISLKYLDSSIASLLLSLESLFGAISGIIILHETMTPKMILGCIFIFIAIILAENGGKLFKKNITN